MDYKCEDGRIPVPASCVTASIPCSLSSKDTWINPEKTSWVKHSYLKELDFRKPSNMGSISQRGEELRLYNLLRI
jgi:hypothetical protein